MKPIEHIKRSIIEEICNRGFPILLITHQDRVEGGEEDVAGFYIEAKDKITSFGYEAEYNNLNDMPLVELALCLEDGLTPKEIDRRLAAYIKEHASICVLAEKPDSKSKTPSEKDKQQQQQQAKLRKILKTLESGSFVDFLN